MNPAEPSAVCALSIQHPWLDLTLRGNKSYELRGWNTEMRGYIALHAPWGIDFPTAYFFGYEHPWNLPRGVIVGVADLVGVRNLEEGDWLPAVRNHCQVLPFSGGSYAMEFASVLRLPRPVPCRGRQMIFSVEFDVAAKVLAQIPSELRTRFAVPRSSARIINDSTLLDASE